MTVEVRGLRRTFDLSFYDFGSAQPQMHLLLDHHVDIGDICFEEDGCIPKSFFDVALAHFTFSLWATETDSRCQAGYRNIAHGLKKGGRLITALSELHDPAANSIEVYDKKFTDVGLKSVSVTRVWDVYDLSSSDRRQLVDTKKAQVVRKQVILAVSEKA